MAKEIIYEARGSSSIWFIGSNYYLQIKNGQPTCPGKQKLSKHHVFLACESNLVSFFWQLLKHITTKLAPTTASAV